MLYLKQSTAATVKIGPFLDDADGKTVEDGLTIAQAAVRLSKNGGDIAQKNDATGCTHDELGYYNCPLSTTDTGTLGQLTLAVHATGALPVWHEFSVVTANVYDTLFSTAKLDVNAATIANGAVTAAAIATDAIDADAIKADAVAEIQNGLATSTAVGNLPTAATIADAVWDEAQSGHHTAGTFGNFFWRLWCRVSGKKYLSDAGDSTIISYDEDGTTPVDTWTQSTVGDQTIYTRS